MEARDLNATQNTADDQGCRHEILGHLGGEIDSRGTAKDNGRCDNTSQL